MRQLCAQPVQRVDQLAAKALRAFIELFILDHVEHRMRRGNGERIACVSAAEATRGRSIHDLGTAADRRERQSAAQALGHRDQIGQDLVMLHREPLAGARKAGLDLVGNQHDAVAVADLAQAAHELA